MSGIITHTAERGQQARALACNVFARSRRIAFDLATYRNAGSIIAKCFLFLLTSAQFCSIAVAAISESNVRRPSDFAYSFSNSYASCPIAASM